MTSRSAQQGLFDALSQPELPGDMAPAAEWDRDIARRALDELFNLTLQYRASSAYYDLLKFVRRFRFYSPFNAMLVQVQMPGATYVASPSKWLRDYKRHIRPGARPLVILQPRGPVMFVFDVSDTEPEKDAPPLPPEVTQPFEPRHGKIGNQHVQTIENALRDGVRVVERDAGSQSAGVIRSARPGEWLSFRTKLLPVPEFVQVPLRYDVFLNGKQSLEARYATLVHELAHLYCGHLGTPNSKWWHDRRSVRGDAQECEAESICYLVCSRLGIDNPSEAYLAEYVSKHDETPPISLELVMKVAGLIEQMGRERLEPRKDTDH